MAWKSFSYIENQGEITGKSFRTQTEQAINDIALYAESAIEIGLGDAIKVAVDEAAETATAEVKTVAVTTTPQKLSEDKKNQARLNIDVPNVNAVVMKSGNRGVLSGKSTAEKVTLSGSREIADDEVDALYIDATGALTLNFVVADETTYAVKTIAIKASATSSLSVTGAEWANNPPSDWGTTGDFIVIDARFVFGKVVLSVVFKGK